MLRKCENSPKYRNRDVLWLPINNDVRDRMKYKNTVMNTIVGLLNRDRCCDPNEKWDKPMVYKWLPADLMAKSDESCFDGSNELWLTLFIADSFEIDINNKIIKII